MRICIGYRYVLDICILYIYVIYIIYIYYYIFIYQQISPHTTKQNEVRTGYLIGSSTAIDFQQGQNSRFDCLVMNKMRKGLGKEMGYRNAKCGLNQ